MKLMSCKWCGLVYDKKEVQYNSVLSYQTDEEGNHQKYFNCKGCGELVYQPKKKVKK